MALEGDAELLRLAELLTIGATTARAIADVRGQDRAVIYSLSAQADAMADTLRRICVDRDSLTRAH